MSNEEVWVFGYGSLIWYRPKIKHIEEKICYLEGWHRDWTWISSSRHGAPTCSLQPGGRVKGVFLRLDPKTQDSDLKMLRRRELASSEEIVKNVCGISGKVCFWKMNNNLAKYEDAKGLTGIRLYEALAKRAKSILIVGPDGKTPEEYALEVHKFDPNDEITKMYVNELQKLSESDEKRDPSQVIQAVSGKVPPACACMHHGIFHIWRAQYPKPPDLVNGRLNHFLKYLHFRVPNLFESASAFQKPFPHQ